MDKEKFSKIYDALAERVAACKEYFAGIVDKQSLGEISVNKLVELKNFTDEEYEKQSRILMVDLYHVIGMTDMSAIQLAKLIKLFKEYASFRPDTNAISKWNGNIGCLPKIPTATKFRLLELGGVTVHAQRTGVTVESDEEDEIIESVDTYREKSVKLDASIDIPVKQEDEDLPTTEQKPLFSLDTNGVLTFDKNDLPEVAKALLANMVTYKGGGMKLTNMVAKWSSLKTYGGFMPNVDITGSLMRLVAVSDETKKHVKEAFKKSK